MRSYTIPAAKPMAAPRSGPAAMPPPMATSSIRSAWTPNSARFDSTPSWSVSAVISTNDVRTATVSGLGGVTSAAPTGAR